MGGAYDILRKIKFNQLNKSNQLNMNSKSFFTSKINWAAIVIILVSFKDAIANLDISTMTVQSWITFGIGLLIVVLRTYFSGTTIK